MVVKIKEVFIVGYRGAEDFCINSVHQNYKSALSKWNNLRKKLIQDTKERMKSNSYNLKEINSKILKNLSCINPDEIDNYPFETPFINRFDLLE